MPATCVKDFALTIKEFSLMAYWTLNENAGGSGGPRIDNVDGIVLNPTADTTWTGGGKISRAVRWAVFDTGTLESQATEPDLLYNGTGMAFFGWIRIPAAGAGEEAPLFNYKFIDGGGAVVGELDCAFDNDTTTINCVLSGFGAPISIALVQNIADSAFHFFVVWYDIADKKIHISIDNGVVNDSATALASILLGFPNGRLTFEKLGNLSDVIIDEFGIFTGVPTAACRTALYNGGAGVTWPAVETACN
jgi:hypothetical protein